MPDWPDIDNLMATAAQALTRAWGSDVTLYLQDPIRTEWGRHSLLLCNVDGPAGTPATVVVKVAVERNQAIFNEWAVLEWLNGIAAVAPLVPDLYAGDTDVELIVVEDLGAGPSLHRLLQTRTEWVTEALVESQQLTAIIHNATRGHETDLLRVREALPKGTPPPLIDTSPEALRTEMEAWCLSLPSSLADEIDAVSAALDVPASFQCLTFHDSCPVNRIVTSAGLWAIDLEMAGFRHPMIDGAYGAIGHLRCTFRRLRNDDGIAFPSSVRSLITDAYRNALQAGYPEYEDEERFRDDLAAASAVWMIEILRRTRPQVRDDKPERFFGVSACQRVLATLAAFSDLAAETGRLPAFASWSDELRIKLEDRWPEIPPLAKVAGLG